MTAAVSASQLSSTQEKFDHLRSDLRRYLETGLVVALSGGVDSTFLTWAAEQERIAHGGRLLALTTSSDSLSTAERNDVEKFIAQNGIAHVWVESREFHDPEYLKNDAQRCYRCKTELFGICHDTARERGLANIAYGYNASDRGDIRPGHKAALENNIISPLADAKLTKDEIRDLMGRHGLELADKPASPCLSSRVVTGVSITPAKLHAVDRLESYMRGLGFRVFRVRVHESGGRKLARIETAVDEIEAAFQMRGEIAAEAKRLGFRWCTIDLDGYKTGGGNTAP